MKLSKEEIFSNQKMKNHFFDIITEKLNEGLDRIYESSKENQILLDKIKVAVLTSGIGALLTLYSSFGQKFEESCHAKTLLITSIVFFMASMASIITSFHLADEMHKKDKENMYKVHDDLYQKIKKFDVTKPDDEQNVIIDDIMTVNAPKNSWQTATQIANYISSIGLISGMTTGIITFIIL